MTKLMSSFEDLQEMLWRFASHRVLTVATKLGVLHRLAREAATPEALASELSLAPLATGKIVRALAAHGVLEPLEQGSYRLAPALAPLFDGGETDLGPFVAHSHGMYERWGENLEDWVRGKEAPRTGPPNPAAFAAAMQALGGRLAPRVAAAVDLSGTQRMLDVGGSLGHYAKAFCDVAPELSATVVDSEAVAELGRQSVVDTPYAGRVDYRGGDYHALDLTEGGPYDLALLSNVLHQETAERARALVERAAAALGPGGRLVVLEFVIDDDQHDHAFGALFAVNMRSFGDTYSEPTLRGWLEGAGLTDVTRTDLDRQRWLIIGRRPPV